MKYGSAMSEGRPRGTVTFLFTDIEDSTRWWDEAPTDMAGALQVHDDIVRGAIESHSGYVFGTGGDGFSAAFSTAADAATAAVVSQELLAEADTSSWSKAAGDGVGMAPVLSEPMSSCSSDPATFLRFNAVHRAGDDKLAGENARVAQMARAGAL